MNLKGKNVLITGSTDGLGKVLAQELIKKGAKVIVHGRESSKVDAVVKELGADTGIVCDLNVPDRVSKAFSSIKSLDILVNNAGVWAEGATKDATDDKIVELVNVNLASHLIISKTLLLVLLKSEFGQILNTVSVAGIEIPFDYFHTIYTATKYGMQGFSEALAKEFDNTNLRIMGFYPGGMETEIFVKAGNGYKHHEPWMFDPQESADAMIFMLTRNEKINIKRLDLINHLQK